MLRLIVAAFFTALLAQGRAQVQETCITTAELDTRSNNLEQLIAQRLDAVELTLAELLDRTCSLPTCPPPGETHAPGTVTLAYISTPMHWREALGHCRSMGGDLPSIHSAEEEAQIRALVPEGIPAYWVGINDVNNDGVVVWSDKSPMDFPPNWGYNHPQRGDCGAFNTFDDFWWDIPCAIVAPFVCQFVGATQVPLTTVEAPQPTSTGAGTQPIDVTQPTDVTQPQPTVDETQPLPTGTAVVGNLVFVAEPRNWAEALQHCHNLGGDFPSIHDAETEQEIRALGATHDVTAYWTGLHDSETATPLEWSDQTPVDFVGTWGPGDPQEGECGAFTNADSFWWDVPCLATLPFICRVPV